MRTVMADLQGDRGWCAADLTEESELVVDTAEELMVTPQPCRFSRLARGVALAIALVVALVLAKRRVCSTQRHVLQDAVAENNLILLMERDPEGLVNIADEHDDPDAMIEWLSSASVAGQVAEEAGASPDMNAEIGRAIHTAMNVTNGSEARKIVQRAMGRAVSKWKSKRHELKKFLRAHRHNLKRAKRYSEAGKATTASCVFNVLQATDALVSVGANINDATRTCNDHLLKRSEWNTTETRVCLVNVAAIFASMGTLGGALAVAADSCAATLVPNVDALCAAAILGMATALSQISGGATLMWEACREKGWFNEIPLGVTPSNLGVPGTHGTRDYKGLDVRRLTDIDHAHPRRLLYGGGKSSTLAQCLVQVTSSAWFLAQAALSINSAANKKGTRTCPPKNLYGGTKYKKGPLNSKVYEVHEAFCTLDVFGAIVGFGEAASFLQLAAVSCPDVLNLDVMCGAGAAGTITGAGAVGGAATALYLACDEFQKRPLKDLIGVARDVDTKIGGRLSDLVEVVAHMGGEASSMTDNNFGRRLDVAAMENKVAALKERFSSPTEVWRSIGYDLDDPHAAFRSRMPRGPSREELLSLVQDTVESTHTVEESQLFGHDVCR